MPENNIDAEIARQEITRICHLAWQTDLMRGFSGNASMRLASGSFLVTPSGVVKGRLRESDLLVVDPDGVPASGQQGRPSIETRLHLGLYNAFAGVNAILHTHPVWLQAVEQRLEGQDLGRALLNLSLTEADYWRERLVIVPEHAPGSPELAGDAVKAVQRHWQDDPHLPCAIWLSGHGLCALGECMDSALGISEQLDHIAHVQWASL